MACAAAAPPPGCIVVLVAPAPAADIPGLALALAPTLALAFTVVAAPSAPPWAPPPATRATGSRATPLCTKAPVKASSNKASTSLVWLEKQLNKRVKRRPKNIIPVEERIAKSSELRTLRSCSSALSISDGGSLI
jgi:hypothetical protein